MAEVSEVEVAKETDEDFEASSAIPFPHFEIEPPADEREIFKTVRYNDRVGLGRYLNHGGDINTVHEGSPCSIKLRSLVRHIRLTGYSLLHIAVLHSSLETIIFLLDKGADVNIVDATKRSSLHLAAAVDRADVVKLLIDRGIDVNIQASSGKTAIMEAVLTNSRIVKLLIDAKSDLDISDYKGTTAVYLAAGTPSKVNFDTVKYLIEGGCDVNKGNLRGGTPLMHAVSMRSIPVVELLLSSGAEVNQLDKNQSSAVHFSLDSRKHLLSLLGLLVAYGADVNIRSKKGDSPLDLAIRYGNITAIKTLLTAECEWTYQKLTSERVEYLCDLVPSFKEWLHREMYCPCSLLRICRKCVRTSLGPVGLPQIPSFQLPHTVKNYLLLKV